MAVEPTLPGVKPAKPALLSDARARKAWKTNFYLHVLLIMKTDGLSKADAQIQAYYETVDGLNVRA